MSIIYKVTNQYSISKDMPPGLIIFSLFNLSSELLVISFFCGQFIQSGRRGSGIYEGVDLVRGRD